MISRKDVFSVKTPEDIMKITKQIRYDNLTPEENYIVKTPDTIISKRIGVCYDIVELERQMFKSIGYKFKTYFAYENLPVIDYPTHTFLVFEEDKKLYWFESSWESYRAIHGPYKHYKYALKYFTKQIKQSLKWKNVNILEYLPFNYKNKNINQFGQYIINHYNLVYKE